jgi:hypothetical protein
VRAPAAYVELGPIGGAIAEPPRKTETPSEGPDLVRSAIDALTRSVEATQRTQIEHERGMAHREKSITEAQIEMQRRDKEIISLLLDRATGGKPKDSLTALQEHTKFQKAVEAITGSQQRNAAIVVTDDDGDAAVKSTKNEEGLGKWVTMLAPLVPHVTDYIASSIEDPQKADSFRRNGAALSQLAEAFGRGVSDGNLTIPSMPVALPTRVEPSRSTPRALREVLAILDDADADSLADHLDELDDAAFNAVAQHAQSIASVEARVAWTRGLLEPAVAPAPAKTAMPAAAEAIAAGLPPALLPVVARLTPSERTTAMQLLQVLDAATIEHLKARLLTMSPEQAAATIRETIAEVNRRGASLAQRAVFAALHRNDAPSSGGATS